jgi:superfamily II DNA or RNA helicase
VSFERVLMTARARYFTGLTATPQRRDGHHPIIYMQLGPIRYSVQANKNAARNPFKQQLIVRDTDFQLKSAPQDESGIQGLYTSLVSDQQRNDLIFDDVVQALEERRSPILLTERRDHLDHFAARLQLFTRNLIILHGKMKKSERTEVLKRLAAIPDGDERLIIATGRYIGEGFDDGRLDTLFLALPVSWKGILIQYAGRLHRTHPGKQEVRIYDYVDRRVPILEKMFEKRVRGYRAMGYNLIGGPIAGKNENSDGVHTTDRDTIEIFDHTRMMGNDDEA